MHRKPCHVTILEIDWTTVGPDQSHYKIERGRFTSTIWAQQADYLTFVDVYIDPVYYRSATVNFDHFIRTENRLFDSPSCFTTGDSSFSLLGPFAFGLFVAVLSSINVLVLPYVCIRPSL